MGIEGQNLTLKKEGFIISRDVISVLKLFCPQIKGIKKICSFAWEHSTVTLLYE